MSTIGARLKEFQASEVERILSACTRCGKCYEVCPMTQYSKAPATDGGLHRQRSRRASEFTTRPRNAFTFSTVDWCARSEYAPAQSSTPAARSTPWRA
jgi:ferredoxin